MFPGEFWCIICCKIFKYSDKGKFKIFISVIVFLMVLHFSMERLPGGKLNRKLISNWTKKTYLIYLHLSWRKCREIFLEAIYRIWESFFQSFRPEFLLSFYLISLASKIPHCLSANHNPELRCIFYTSVTFFALYWCYTWTTMLSAFSFFFFFFFFFTATNNGKSNKLSGPRSSSYLFRG